MWLELCSLAQLHNLLLHLLLRQVANKRITWTWYATFGANVNHEHYCGLQKHWLPTLYPGDLKNPRWNATKSYVWLRPKTNSHIILYWHNRRGWKSALTCIFSCIFPPILVKVFDPVLLSNRTNTSVFFKATCMGVKARESCNLIQIISSRTFTAFHTRFSCCSCLAADLWITCPSESDLRRWKLRIGTPSVGGFASVLPIKKNKLLPSEVLDTNNTRLHCRVDKPRRASWHYYY